MMGLSVHSVRNRLSRLTEINGTLNAIQLDHLDLNEPDLNKTKLLVQM